MPNKSKKKYFQIIFFNYLFCAIRCSKQSFDLREIFFVNVFSIDIIERSLDYDNEKLIDTLIVIESNRFVITFISVVCTIQFRTCRWNFIGIRLLTQSTNPAQNGTIYWWIAFSIDRKIITNPQEKSIGGLITRQKEWN